jgi:hypothetical protein
VNPAEIENGIASGQVDGPSCTGDTPEHAGPRPRVDKTARQPLGVNGEEAEDQPEEFQWSKARHKIRVAAKEYRKDTHADY